MTKSTWPRVIKGATEIGYGWPWMYRRRHRARYEMRTDENARDLYETREKKDGRRDAAH